MKPSKSNPAIEPENLAADPVPESVMRAINIPKAGPESHATISAEAAAELEALTDASQNAEGDWPILVPDSLRWVNTKQWPKSKWTKKDSQQFEVWKLCAEFLAASTDNRDHWRWKAKDARQLSTQEQDALNNWLQMREDNLRNLKEHEQAVHAEEKEKVRLAQLREEQILRDKSSFEFVFRPYLPKEFEPVITRQTLRCIIAGGQIGAKIKLARLKIQPEIERWETLQAAKGKASWQGYRDKRQEVIAENAEDLSQGHGDLRDLPSSNKYADEMGIRKGLIKEQQKQIGNLVNPIIQELGALLQEAARDASRELLISERRQTDEWGIKFEPSPVLTILVYCGFALKSFVTTNWSVGPLVSPRDVIYGILDTNSDWI